MEPKAFALLRRIQFLGVPPTSISFVENVHSTKESYGTLYNHVLPGQWMLVWVDPQLASELLMPIEAQKPDLCLKIKGLSDIMLYCYNFN